MKTFFLLVMGYLLIHPSFLSGQYSVTVVDDPPLTDVTVNRIITDPNDATLLLTSTDIYTYTDHVTDTFSCPICNEITDVAFVKDTMYIANNWTGIVKRFGDSTSIVAPFNVLRLVAGKDGRMYAIDFSDGIVTWNGTEWTHLTTENSFIPTDYIYDLAVDSNGLLWMATYVGLVSFDGLNFSLKSVPDDLSSTFYNLVIDYFQNIWVSSAYGGVGRYRGGVWKTFPTIFNPFTLVQNITTTNGNKIWTSEMFFGLYKYTGVAFEKIPFEDLGFTDWGNNSILFGDAQKRLWIKNDFMPLMYLSSGTTAVQDDKKIFQRLRAYPNPASEEVYFPIGNPQGGPFQLFIYNQQGLLVYNEPLQSNDLERINLSGWASGIYEAVVIGKKGKVLGGRFCISARE